MEAASDPVLDRIGNWGRWQAIKIAAFGWVGFFFGWHMLAVNLLVPEQEFWCSPESLGLEAGVRPDDWNTTDGCTFAELGEQVHQICTRWDYDRSTWPETAVSQFDLVCDRDYLRSLSQSLYMFGVMVGSFVSGLASDRFGRHRVTLISAFGLLASGIAVSFSASMAVFTFLRCLVAMFSVSCFTTGFCYCMEIVGGRAATIVGIGLQCYWSLAYMLLPLVSWAFPRWNHLQLAVSIPVIVLVILLLIPGLTTESPRWLLSRGRVEEATAILDTAARRNQVPAKVEGKAVSQGEKVAEAARGNITHLFRSRGLLRSTLIMYYLFFTNSFVYYGLTLNSGSLIPGNIHVNIVVSGLLEILANVCTIVAFLVVGRRISVCVSMGLGGLTLFFVPVAASVTGKAVLAQIGKFAITGSFSMVFVYAVEVFPTVIRNAGLGSASVLARVGGIVAPYIGRELGKVSKSAPLYIFGVTSVLAAILVLFLPETKGLTPPDTLEEGERLNREAGGLAMCRRARVGPEVPMAAVNSTHKS